MTAVQLERVQEGQVPVTELPAVPVQLPEVGRMRNVILGVLLLVLLSSVVLHYL